MRSKSWTTTEGTREMTDNEFAPVTPGEMLKEEFLVEYGLSQNQLAKAIGISPNRIAEIVNNRRRITADTALRLSLYFGNSPEFWLNLQTRYDLKIARRELRSEDAKRIKSRHAANFSLRIMLRGPVEIAHAQPLEGPGAAFRGEDRDGATVSKRRGAGADAPS
jgi:antitoxin HigA-1